MNMVVFDPTCCSQMLRMSDRKTRNPNHHTEELYTKATAVNQNGMDKANSISFSPVPWEANLGYCHSKCSKAVYACQG